MKDAGDETAEGHLGILGFDPDAVLLKEPGMLLDRQFLSALHAELRSELGGRETDLTLFQMGFLHGLQDALRTGDAFAEPLAPTRSVVGPPMAIHLRCDPAAAGAAGVAVHGSWPEKTEASARLASSGELPEPGCFVSAGYTSGWLSGTFDADVLAFETSCTARGDEHCEFAALEVDAWRGTGDPDVQEFLEALPFDAFRAFVRAAVTSDHATDVRTDHANAVREADSEEAVVHIWGPVMVVPFADGEEALKAVELIGRDPAASDVSVVVVDLSGAIVDEAYGAVALEQMVDLIEAWGAEAIFAEVSPLSEPVIAELHRQPLLTHKDLDQAIAAAFRVADAQRTSA